MDERRNSTSEMHQRETGPAQIDKPQDKPDYSRADALATESFSDSARMAAAVRAAEDFKPRDKE